MSLPRLVVHAASVGAIDFTAAAHWAARGAPVSVFVNTQKTATPNLNNTRFDAIAGLPTGRLSRSPDGRFRTLYTTFGEFGIEGIVLNVAAEMSKFIPEAADLLVSRAKRLAQRAAALPPHLDWRVRVLSAVYPLLGLDVKVSELNALVSERDGRWLLSRIESLGTRQVDNHEPFLRGGRIEHGKASGTAIYQGIAQDLTGVLSASSGAGLTVPALDLAAWEAGSIRLRGSLDLLYGVDADSAAGHLPWHSRAIDRIAPAAAYEIVSPPCRVMSSARRLNPSGYALLDYDGLAQEYARRLVGPGFWSQAFDLVLADTDPVREKYSQSQRSARRLALQALSDDSATGLLSDCALAWRRCRSLLGDGTEPPAAEIRQLAEGVAHVAVVLEAMLLSVNLADFEVNGVQVCSLRWSLQQVESGDSWRDRVSSLRRACEQVSELLLGAAMLVYEAILRADIIRVYLLCGDASALTELQSRRESEEYLAWEPVVLKNESAT